MTNDIKHQAHSSSNPTVARFVGLAMGGLAQMFDEPRQLFCYRLKKTNHGLIREGISWRYTAITLLGLHRLEEAGRLSSIDPKPVLQALLANSDRLENIGDLGLLLWLCALMAPDSLAEIESRLDLAGALTRWRDAQQGLTMELAWFLSGLSHWGLALPEELSRLRDLAYQTYMRLAYNQGPRGIFGHLARNGSPSSAVRGRIGSFADQVYPIYAMSKFFQAYKDETAAQAAIQCARAICDLQGPLGQWWWHYDSMRGTVLERYPVFSVHQHGMAPMTLFALGEATQADFSPWIYKGLGWIDSANELGFNMEHRAGNVIWRCIYRPGLSRYWNLAMSGWRNRESQGNLNVCFECRPYELGWLLYALAGR